MKNKLFVWKNAWLYNGQGILMALAEDQHQGLELVFNYLEEIQFCNLPRSALKKLVIQTIPQAIDYGAGFVLWEEEIQTNNSEQTKADKLFLWRTGLKFDDNGTFFAYSSSEEMAELLVQKVMIDKYLFLPDQAKECFQTLVNKRKLEIHQESVGYALWRGSPWE